MFKRLAGLVTVALLLCASSAQAGVYKLDFTCSDFIASDENFPNAPDAVVSGSFIYYAADATGHWDQLLGIDLTISGHKFTLDEVAKTDFFDMPLVGGKVGGLTGVGDGVNDFILLPEAVLFIYSTKSTEGSWYSTSPQISVTELTVVPEPETYAMLLAGLGLMGFVARRRKA